MLEVVINGLLRPDADSALVTRYLMELKVTLVGYLMPVMKLARREEDGKLVLELLDAARLQEDIITPLTSFAEDLARQINTDVAFHVSVPRLDFESIIAGAA